MPLQCVLKLCFISYDGDQRVTTGHRQQAKGLGDHGHKSLAPWLLNHKTKGEEEGNVDVGSFCQWNRNWPQPVTNCLRWPDKPELIDDSSDQRRTAAPLSRAINGRGSLIVSGPTSCSFIGRQFIGQWAAGGILNVWPWMIRRENCVGSASDISRPTQSSGWATHSAMSKWIRATLVIVALQPPPSW